MKSWSLNKGKKYWTQIEKCDQVKRKIKLIYKQI